MRDDGDTLLHRGRQVAEKSENAATAFAAVAAPPISRMPLHFRSFGQVSRSGIASCLYLQAPYSCSRNNSASPCRRALGLSFPSRMRLRGGVFPISCFLCPLYSVWPQGLLLSAVDHDGSQQLKNPGDWANCDLHWFAISLAIIALGRRTPIGGPGVVRNPLDSS